MKRLLLAAAIGLIGLTSAVSAMPLSHSAAAISSDSSIIMVKGGHGHGRGHGWGRGGRGHHYGWYRGRGHHYGWSRGRHRGWH